MLAPSASHEMMRLRDAILQWPPTRSRSRLRNEKRPLKRKYKTLSVSLVARDHKLRLPQLKPMRKCQRTLVTWTSQTTVVKQHDGGTAPRSSSALLKKYHHLAQARTGMRTIQG